MMHIPPQRPRAAAKTQDDQAWRTRTAMAGGLVGTGIVGIAAANLDWSAGAALALSELAGIVAPFAIAAAAAWGVIAFCARKA